MTTTYYKVLNTDGSSYHGGTGVWSLPHDGQPGEWMPKLDADRLELCVYGYHYVTLEHLPQWIGTAIWTVEIRGQHIDGDDKSVTQQARLLVRQNWDERIARLYAADCAEHVLPFWEHKYPNDIRPRACIETARKFANGEATREELHAAWAAADAAAWAAAYAARAAADAARSGIQGH